MEHEAITELKSMEKTMENTKAYINKHLPVVAFHFYQSYGFPVEMFEEEIKDLSALEVLILIINHYKNK